MKIYKILFHGDPDHEALLIEVQSEIYNLYHVTGDPIRGFDFEIKRNYKYLESYTYIEDSKEFIGEINLCLDSLESILEQVPVQEPISFKEVIRLKRGVDYGDCRTWVKEAINMLLYE